MKICRRIQPTDVIHMEIATFAISVDELHKFLQHLEQKTDVSTQTEWNIELLTNLVRSRLQACEASLYDQISGLPPLYDSW